MFCYYCFQVYLFTDVLLASMQEYTHDDHATSHEQRRLHHFSTGQSDYVHILSVFNYTKYVCHPHCGDQRVA